MPSPTVAIIGAGLSGALCAHQLSSAGWQVKIFEKSRGVGGRMATRRTRILGPTGAELVVEFDHGAPDFAPADRSPAFASWLKQAQAAGIVAPWGSGSTALGSSDPSSWTATPDMPSLCRWLLEGLSVQTLCTIDALKRTTKGWAVASAGQDLERGFDAVIIAIPPAQAAALLKSLRDDWAQAALAQTMSPCWTLMAVTDDPVRPLDSLSSHVPSHARAERHWQTGKFTPPGACPLAMIIRQDAKPGRLSLPGLASWVAHARSDWTQAHLEADPETVLPILKSALQEVMGPSVPWHHAAVHRWRYAQFEGPAPSAMCLWDPGLGLGLCGDAWGRGGVGGAWDSASGLCGLMLSR